MASNVAAGRREHREALVGLGAPAALTSLLQSGQLDLQQEAAYGIWNMVAHDRQLLLQASRDDRVMAAYVSLVRALSPPVVRCVSFGGRGSVQRGSVPSRGFVMWLVQGGVGCGRCLGCFTPT